MDIYLIITIFGYVSPTLCEASTTTNGPISCPTGIPNGTITTGCSRTVSSYCTYLCDYPWCSKRFTRLFCNPYGSWSAADMACLCEEETITTEDPVLCPYYIPNGRMVLCNRKPMSPCFVLCDIGCRTTNSVITCDPYGKWLDGETACKCTEVTTTPDSVLCPYRIPNGRTMSCNRRRNTTCWASCDPGCRATTSPLTCDAYGNWIGGDTACNCPVQSTVRCPGYIPHGSIVYYCRQSPESYCKYTCYSSGCTPAFPSLLCLWNGTWLNGDTACNCEEATTTPDSFLCPYRIPNGRMMSCSRQRYTTCRASCDSGCRATTSSLTCDSYGNWIGGDTACNCSGQCPVYIPNGTIDNYCKRSSLSSCKYTCHFGCMRNFAYLQCSWTGNWLSVDTACICKGPVLCSKEIDNGHVKDTCSRKDGANCTYDCVDNCDKYPKENSLLCRNGTWYSARPWTMYTGNPCICDPSANKSVSTNTNAFIAGILGGATFLIIVWITACIIVVIRKRRQIARAGGSTTMTAVSQQPPGSSRTRATAPHTTGTTASTQGEGIQNGVSSPIYMVSNTLTYQSVQYTASQNSCYLLPEATTSNGTAYPDAPPSYSSIAAAKSEELQPPPSYEEAISHPISPTT